jgi:NhaP-type Na+/H+ or K+/H+ antiporter
MHEHVAFLLTALLILLFGLFSKASEKLPVTAPMVFAGVGMMVSPLGFGLFDVDIDAELVKVLAEITLILVLFTDATEINLARLKEQKAYIPLRLLAIGLPLTMLLGFIVGAMLFDELSLWLIALIALILSPTDAALGQAVIKSELLPDSLKQTISVESGFNDGIALPPILVCVAALGVSAGQSQDSQNWLQFLFLQLTLGPLIGALVGWSGGWLVEKASQKDLMSPVFQRMSALSLAILAFALAEMVHGNGFIAVFAGGMFLGVQTPAIRERIHEFGEAEGQQLALFIFLLLGMVGVPRFYEYWDTNAFVYSILSLTIIRMVPVALSLIRSGSDWKTCLFVGWFGPRGIASILYLLMVAGSLGSLGITGYEYALSVIILVILMSVFLHGITAVPLVKVYSHSRAME